MSSNDLAVSVRGLSKSYIIAHNMARPTNFREAIVERLRHPLGNGRQEQETFWALKDVDFDIRRGKSVGIIGRNGAGKSTLLKLLSRITYPTTGTIDLYGHVASLLEVGTGFHPELTGRENIYLNGSILGMRRREINRKFDEIVAFAEIDNFLDTPVKRYSSGMYVRLAFAVAAHLTAEILIVDEVLAVGDAAFQKKCLGKMDEVACSGRTVLLVTHNMPTVLQLCDRVIFLKNGRVVREGPAGPVTQDYLSESWREQAEVHDLSACERPMHVNGGARILSCALMTTEKESPWVLPYGAPIRLEIVVRAEKSLADLELGLALCTSSGFEIASTLSRDVIGLQTIQPGRYAFELALPSLVLTPGQYSCGLGLRSERGMEDFLPEAIHFEVVPTTESARLLVHSRKGVVIPKVECHLRPITKHRERHIIYE